jgi:hypothetical protein
MAKREKEQDDGIPEEVVNQMMVACGRRCCICKRYRPTKLQVHHIKEKSQGGTHDPDNLIVTCLSCHSDVHTHVPFARRFTHEELKGHRDTLSRQVAEGRFADDDSDDTDEVIRSVLRAIQASIGERPQLTAYAAEILLCAADAAGLHQGVIMYVRTFQGTSIQANQRNLISAPKDARLTACYKGGLDQLSRYGLIESPNGKVYHVTYEGYLLADELKARGAEALSE